MNAISPRLVAFYSPYLLENEDRYHYWRDAKLKDYPTTLGDLLVDIGVLE